MGTKRVNLVWIFIFCLFGAAGCATRSTPLALAEKISSTKAYFLVHLQFKNPKTEVRLFFDGKKGGRFEFRSKFDKRHNPADGVLIEVPADDSYSLVEMRVDEAEAEVEVQSDAFKHLKTRGGFTSLIGFYEIEKRPGAIFANPLGVDDSLFLFRTAQRKFKLKLPMVLNAFNLKPFVAEREKLSSDYVRGGGGKKSFFDFNSDAYRCLNQEYKDNRIIMGRLRFEAHVKKGKIEDVKKTKANHTASDKYETCVENAVRSAKVSNETFVVQVPGILIR